MDRSVYDRMAELEDGHWWFVGRRGIVSELIERFVPLRARMRLLEAGCGTGGNLSMLSRFGDVDAFELDDAAREIARRKSGLPVARGALPDAAPYEAGDYDVILMLDVLEHIEDDAGALASLRERLSQDGRILVTVPAFQSLWSRHDETHHHFRRYTRTSLAAAAERAGLRVERVFYFNAMLLPVAVTVRWLKAALGRDDPDDAMPAPWLNRVLTRVFRAERHLIGRVPLPAGLSCAAILRADKAP